MPCPAKWGLKLEIMGCVRLRVRVDKADVVCLGVLLLQYKLHAQFQHLHSRAPQFLHSRGRLTPVLQLVNFTSSKNYKRLGGGGAKYIHKGRGGICNLDIDKHCKSTELENVCVTVLGRPVFV